jgi:hypothetical protein
MVWILTVSQKLDSTRKVQVVGGHSFHLLMGSSCTFSLSLSSPSIGYKNIKKNPMIRQKQIFTLDIGCMSEASVESQE